MKNDSYSFHELLDRTNMVAEIVETHLLYHPLMAEPECKDLQAVQFQIEAALAALSQAYQLIGNLPETFT